MKGQIADNPTNNVAKASSGTVARDGFAHEGSAAQARFRFA